MERISTCDLREKEVINLRDGSRLGCPSDFEMSACDGRITALIISRPSGFLWLSHQRDLCIPWDRIECIGEDAILVRLTEADCCGGDLSNKKNKRFF